MNDDDKKLEQTFAEEDHGGIAPELEGAAREQVAPDPYPEAGGMSRGDGLGGPESGPLGDDHMSRATPGERLYRAFLACEDQRHLARSTAWVSLTDVRKGVWEDLAAAIQHDILEAGRG